MPIHSLYANDMRDNYREPYTFIAEPEAAANRDAVAELGSLCAHAPPFRASAEDVISRNMSSGFKRLGIVAGSLAALIVASYAATARELHFVDAFNAAFFFLLYYLLFWCIGWIKTNGSSKEKALSNGALIAELASYFFRATSTKIGVIVPCIT